MRADAALVAQSAARLWAARRAARMCAPASSLDPRATAWELVLEKDTATCETPLDDNENEVVLSNRTKLFTPL